VTEDAEWMGRNSPAGRTPVELDTDRPHPARVYDYLLGGKSNFEADRRAAEASLEANPTGRTGPLENRAFMLRAVRHLAAEAGIRQFLDIGTGIPTSPNVHQVAQSITPAARIVYADNDPIVLSHARALMSSRPEGETAYIEGDMRSPKTVLDAPELRAVLDFDQPIGLLLIATMHLLEDLREAYDVCGEFVASMPAGSHLVLTHLTGDFVPEQMAGVSATYARRGMTLVPRTKAEITRFFDGMEPVAPGVEVVHRWRPEMRRPGDIGGARVTDAEVSIYGGVARI
jgi:S-adenosyl methyltransferase